MRNINYKIIFFNFIIDNIADGIIHVVTIHIAVHRFIEMGNGKYIRIGKDLSEPICSLDSCMRNSNCLYCSWLAT